MASIRTARVAAALAALPLAAACFTGVAQADNGGYADDLSNAVTSALKDSGVGDDNIGNNETTQQVANGPGAKNTHTSANAADNSSAYVDQSKWEINFTQVSVDND
ncbi:hypothetical protein [Streptomyces sp. NPDC003077]|uniref:hypothetical protein n=1 Tax=Streptomyces sp. NPDC003077 TaxID=3154443 RepID=UPI0033AA49BC